MNNNNERDVRARAGRYVKQPSGYKAFIPRRLPPEPPLQFDDAMLEALSRADRAIARLDMTTEILPDPDLFVYMYVRREAVLSSQIEGTQSTLIDLLEYEADATTESQPGDVVEVAGYVSAMNYGLERMATLPLSLRLIREIHAKLLSGGRGSEKLPGEFRRSQKWIGADAEGATRDHAGTAINRAKFVPPPPAEMNRALDDLERYIHDDAPAPILVKVGLIHAQFETIHPFLDGNGRVGRLLITFLLCKNLVLRSPLLYLSYYFRVHRTEYYDRLQGVRDRGDWEGWIKFFLEGIYEVSTEASGVARKIMQLRELHRRVIVEQTGKGANAASKLLEGLYGTPYVTVQAIMRITGLTATPANDLANKFEQLGLLVEPMGRKRKRIFVYRDYVNLFLEPPGDFGS